MTRPDDAVHPSVYLDFTVNEARVARLREEIGSLLGTAGVESITVHIRSALSGIIPDACDLHEYVLHLRANCRIQLRVMVSGRCGASAALVVLAFDPKERYYTDDTMFVLQAPFFEPSGPHRTFEADGDISDVRRTALTSAERFYRLFGEGLHQSATEARQLFTRHGTRRLLTVDGACKLGIVTERVPDGAQLAA